jgi:hypothetical protein
MLYPGPGRDEPRGDTNNRPLCWTLLNPFARICFRMDDQCLSVY